MSTAYTEILNKLYDKWKKKRDKAYNTYQEAGIQRYNREYQDADDICTAIEMALNADNAHHAMTELRMFKDRATKLRQENDSSSKQHDIEMLLYELANCDV
ncbi:MAG: hypothetical protein ILA17_06080 [Ruminococcus sp.]|nr:hypothetical protein [Ruminiclostridium sp.]MBP1537417.1 hypothetical protein [Ruminococcus sp.]